MDDFIQQVHGWPTDPEGRVKVKIQPSLYHGGMQRSYSWPELVWKLRLKPSELGEVRDVLVRVFELLASEGMTKFSSRLMDLG